MVTFLLPLVENQYYRLTVIDVSNSRYIIELRIIILTDGKISMGKRKSHDVLESPHVQQLFSIPHEIREVCLNVFSAHQLQMQITQCIIATSYYTLPFCMSVFFFVCLVCLGCCVSRFGVLV